MRLPKHTECSTQLPSLPLFPSLHHSLGHPSSGVFLSRTRGSLWPVNSCGCSGLRGTSSYLSWGHPTDMCIRSQPFKAIVQGLQASPLMANTSLCIWVPPHLHPPSSNTLSACGDTDSHRTSVSKHFCTERIRRENLRCWGNILVSMGFRARASSFSNCPALIRVL